MQRNTYRLHSFIFKLFSEEIKNELKFLLQKEKFAKEIWHERGLNPSFKQLCNNLQNEFNNIIKALLELPSLSLEIDKINCLKANLIKFDQFELDTEEKELVSDYFSEISKLINVDIDKEVNEWMYGFGVIESIKPKILEPIKSISTPCKNCEVSLIVEIYKERANVQSYWLIVQCNNCNGFNLLTIPENIDRYKTGKYFVFESLKKSEYSIEMALEKMGYYRKMNAY